MRLSIVSESFLRWLPIVWIVKRKKYLVVGCNTCKEKALRAERERIERSMMNRTSSTVVSDMEYASRSTAGCMVMLDPLKTMERDVVSIYKQTRTIGDVGIVYLNMQKKIREWIKNLPYGCPPDEEVQEMRKEILDGRAIYIKP
nr:MAG TPA: hypothetical protein [Caudoviricetes sp.]DAS00076.1 MAG TPA: hypothetical protein [Caudoviricetes sp.]